MIGYMVFGRNVTACLRLIRSTLSRSVITGSRDDTRDGNDALPC